MTEPFDGFKERQRAATPNPYLRIIVIIASLILLADGIRRLVG